MHASSSYKRLNSCMSIFFKNEVRYFPVEYVLVSSSSSLVAALVAANKCYISNPNLETYVKTPEPWTYMSNDELPKAYDPYYVVFGNYV